MKNFTEVLVQDMLADILNTYCERKKICTCERCQLDIQAIALNSLPTQYVVSEEGELYKKVSSLNDQLRIDITEAIVRAIEQVQRNPRH